PPRAHPQAAPRPPLHVDPRPLLRSRQPRTVPLRVRLREKDRPVTNALAEALATAGDIKPGPQCSVARILEGLPADEAASWDATLRSEEHTSELQSRFDLVCRLLLEKKNN